jgi:UDP-N-acetylmuramyl tripeptide synthase
LSIVVDFAHTPNAVENILKFVKANGENNALYGGGRIITVIGQPGGRDAVKRPDVGRVVAKYSDIAVFTADDPRDESVEDICTQINSGIPERSKTALNYEVVVDRKAAIRRAISLATSDDIVMVLGKGAENRQKIGGVDVEYNDKRTVYEILDEMKGES